MKRYYLKPGIHSLKFHRIDMCIDLIHKMSHPQHILHYLLPNRLSEMSDRVTTFSVELNVLEIDQCFLQQNFLTIQFYDILGNFNQFIIRIV